MIHGRTFSGCLVLLVVGLYACSQQPPANLAQQVAGADRTVVSNWNQSVTLTITGEEVAKVGRAVTSAKQDKHAYDGIWNWDLQFYAGTNFLTLVHLMDRTFWTADTQYRDDTGVLKAFYRRVINDPRFASAADRR
jgi:hypothetical protein